MPSLLRTLLTSLTALSAVVTATPHPRTSNLSVSVLHEFGYPSWLENLAIRSNGEILTTRLDRPALYQVNHVTGATVEIATWNGSQWAGCLGIAETTKDVFYVILAALFQEGTFLKTGGVNSIFKVDMNTFKLGSDGTTIKKNATVSHVTDIPEADFLNGMATLDDEHIFVSDVYSGTVYLVDVATGGYQLAVNDTLMKWSVAGNPPPAYLGSNGLKIRDSHLYWSNTAAGFLARIEIGTDGLPIGRSSVAVTNVARADDFQFRNDGTVFVAQNQMDTLSVAYPNYKANVSVAAKPIAGSNISTVLAGVSSPKFGRTHKDKNRLYLSTSGALALPINGTVTVNGTISYVDIEF